MEKGIKVGKVYLKGILGFLLVIIVFLLDS